eukprot:3022452-Prymnesium_polylepis.1
MSLRPPPLPTTHNSTELNSFSTHSHQTRTYPYSTTDTAHRTRCASAHMAAGDSNTRYMESVTTHRKSI